METTETTQRDTTSKPKSRRSSRKPSTVPPKASARAKRAAAASGKRKRAKASTKRSTGARKESPEQRAHRIAVAAYFLAEQRGFAPNGELDDWLAAERSL